MSGHARGDDGWYDDLPRVDVVIPDDPRELDADARIVRRELRWERRRAKLRQIFTGRWRRFAVSAPLVIALLVVIGLVASTLGVLRPRAPERPDSLPLAERPPASPGAVGGLLPPGDVVIDGVRQDVRSLRPAVLALVPAECACERRLDALFAQVHQYALDLYLIGEPTYADQLTSLSGKVGNGTAIPVLDDSLLAGAYPSTDLVAVLVHADGIVRAIHSDVSVAVHLEPELSLLSMPGDR